MHLLWQRNCRYWKPTAVGMRGPIKDKTNEKYAEEQKVDLALEKPSHVHGILLKI